MAARKDNAVSGFVALSCTIGRNVDFTQGPGGNAAVKSPDGKTMIVKTSGRPMGEMTARAGFRVLDLKKLRAILKTRPGKSDPVELQLRVNDHIAAASVDGKGKKDRPSLETLLHAQLGTCSIHVHPPNLIGLISSKNGKSVAMDLLKEYRPLWLPYANPGFAVATAYRRAAEMHRRKYRDEPRLILMEKHGACLVADTPEQLIDFVREALRIVDAFFGAQPTSRVKRYGSDRERKFLVTNALESAYQRVYNLKMIVERVDDGYFRRTMGSGSHRELILSGALTPEQVAYAGGEPISFNGDALLGLEEQAVAVFRSRKAPPAAVVLGGAGLFISAPSPEQWEAARDMTLASARSIVVAGKFGGPTFLRPAERDYVIRLKTRAAGD